MKLQSLRLWKTSRNRIFAICRSGSTWLGSIPITWRRNPLKPLVDKGRDYTEEDKVTLFDGILALIKRVLPTTKNYRMRAFWRSPLHTYAHPILPLIYDSDLALVGNPKAIMPKQHFSYPEDAAFHLQKSVEMYESIFGREVRGLWPGEGSVAEEIVPLVNEAGYQWMQTGEPVLVASLGLAGDRFGRDGEGVVKDPTPSIVHIMFRARVAAKWLFSSATGSFRTKLVSIIQAWRAKQQRRT
jgi:alpha-amylase/alpha-mannosidase (GH57 family)